MFTLNLGTECTYKGSAPYKVSLFLVWAYVKSKDTYRTCLKWAKGEINIKCDLLPRISMSFPVYTVHYVCTANVYHALDHFSGYDTFHMNVTGLLFLCHQTKQTNISQEASKVPCHTQIQCPHYLVFPALGLFLFWQMKNFSTEGVSLMTRKQHRFSVLLLSLHFAIQFWNSWMQDAKDQWPLWGTARYFLAYSLPPSSPSALGSGLEQDPLGHMG